MSKEQVEDFNTHKEESEKVKSEAEGMEEQELREEEISEEEITEEQEEESAEEEVDELTKLENEITEVKDKHLRLYSEFENFRRRTAKEKLELVKTATEGLMVELLPILDDFERAKNSVSEDNGNNGLDEGFDLIHQKFSRILKSKGLEPMDDKEGTEFDAEVHEAISQIPAPNKKLKGKIVDVIERGYKLNDKVIRFAKVVIGS